MDDIYAMFKKEIAEEIPKDIEEESFSICCKNKEMVDDGDYYVCRNCFVIERKIENCIYTATENYSIIPNHKYIPTIYFKDKLNYFQGKETSKIPSYVIEACNGCKNTYEILNVLKKRKYGLYYKNAVSISISIGLSPPKLSKQEIEKLIFLFNTIYKKLILHINVLNYNFILKQLFLKINRPDLSALIHIRNKKKELIYINLFKNVSL